MWLYKQFSTDYNSRNENDLSQDPRFSTLFNIPSKVDKYKNGKRDGIWVEYSIFDENEVRTVKHYNEWILNWEFIQRDVFDGGILHGYYVKWELDWIWTWYNSKGEVEYIIEYNNWKTLSSKAYYDYKNWILSHESFYNNEWKKIKSIWYHDDGISISSIETFGEKYPWRGVLTREEYDKDWNRIDEPYL